MAVASRSEGEGQQRRKQEGKEEVETSGAVNHSSLQHSTEALTCGARRRVAHTTHVRNAVALGWA